VALQICEQIQRQTDTQRHTDKPVTILVTPVHTTSYSTLMETNICLVPFLNNSKLFVESPLLLLTPPAFDDLVVGDTV